MKAETLIFLEKALEEFPTLLTLEDYVSQFGTDWGFHMRPSRQQKLAFIYFDKLAGFKRYE